MRKILLMGAGLLALGLATTTVYAEEAAPPANGGPAEHEFGPGHDAPPFGHHGPWMHHGPFGAHHFGPPPSKAAFFRLHRGDLSVGIKCADDEPTKVCVDAASALIDKFAAVADKH